MIHDKWQNRYADNILNNAILHIDVRMEGLIIVHNLRPFDKETITLEEEKDEQGHFSSCSDLQQKYI